MEVLVETYEAAEVANEPIDISDEARAMIDEYELEGQQALEARSGDEKARQTRFPYRELTADEARIYELICPAHTDVKQYRACPYPLRVLQVIGHARELFDNLVVWHAQTQPDLDPILIGERKDPAQSWITHRYLLARWGAELEEWPALLKRAAEVYRTKLKVAIAATEELLDIARALAKDASTNVLVRKEAQLPSCYWSRT